jgi:hypothetical protein
MALVPDNLKTEWRDRAYELTADLGYTCRLVFEGGHRLRDDPGLAGHENNGGMPIVVMPFGGRTHGFQNPGHDTMAESVTDANTQRITALENTKDIVARVYQDTKSLDRFQIRVSENTTVYEVITDKKYMPDLERAKHIILYYGLEEREIKAKLIYGPAPYGLGAAVQCTSLWEEI